MIWFRVDNRLVHGQVIEAWLPFLNATKLVVVNDDLAADAIRQQIMMMAIPGRISVSFVPVAEAKALYDDVENRSVKALFLFAECGDVLRLLEQGVKISQLNVGNLHYAKGKRQICPHVAVSEQDLACFDSLKKRGVKLDFHSVPGDSTEVEGW